MKCPICDVSLQMTERQGIEVDYCPQCRGIWLDRGELDKLLDRSGLRDSDPDEGAYSAPGPRHREHEDFDDRRREHDDYDNRRRYKKKSFWREILDFD